MYRGFSLEKRSASGTGGTEAKRLRGGMKEVDQVGLADVLMGFR